MENVKRIDCDRNISIREGVEWLRRQAAKGQIKVLIAVVLGLDDNTHKVHVGRSSYLTDVGLVEDLKRSIMS